MYITHSYWGKTNIRIPVSHIVKLMWFLCIHFTNASRMFNNIQDYSNAKVWVIYKKLRDR